MDTDSLSREVSNKVYFIKAIPRLKSRKKQELKKFGSLDLVPSDHHSRGKANENRNQYPRGIRSFSQLRRQRISAVTLLLEKMRKNT
jgi:hypothetical protein